MKKILLFGTLTLMATKAHATEKRYQIKSPTILITRKDDIIQTDVLNPSCNLIIQKGDITQARVEAIVNAANPQLQAGGGVCGAIFAAAGLDALQQACNNFPLVGNERCVVGDVALTDSFNLKDHGIKHIIHAVGPDYRVNYSWWKPHNWTQEKYLSDTYKNALLATNSVKASSIAFPFISSGIYAFPKEDACKIALDTIISFAQEAVICELHEIHFVLYDDADYELFCSIADLYTDSRRAIVNDTRTIHPIIEK